MTGCAECNSAERIFRHPPIIADARSGERRAASLKGKRFLKMRILLAPFRVRPLGMIKIRR
jgi:hypothetical protein